MPKMKIFQNHARLSHHNRWLIIMIKQPIAGRVKTRLAVGIGSPLAASFYRASSSAVVSRLSRDSRWSTILSIAPDTALQHPQWPRHLPRIAQGRGDLGSRMENAFKMLPPGPAILIGSDIPGIRPQHIAAGFRALGNNDVVFGPSDDGGYWMVGMARRRPVSKPFKGVSWSSKNTLADNLAVLGSYQTALINQLCDIDTCADYSRVVSWAGRKVLPIDAS